MKVEFRWLLKLTHLGADQTKFGHKGSLRAPVEPELTWNNAKSAFKTILVEIPELPRDNETSIDIRNKKTKAEFTPYHT